MIFKKHCVLNCALDESSLSIGKVKAKKKILFVSCNVPKKIGKVDQ